MFFAAFIILAIAACAYYFGPFGPTGQPDPTIIQTAPKPDYFFLWLYALLSLLPPSLETPFLLIGPALGNSWLDSAAVSFRRRRKELEAPPDCGYHRAHDRDHARHVYPSRPVHTVESAHERVERRSSTRRFIHGTTALERQGALVFQVKQCRNCHSLGDTGGQRGPALDSVAVRLTHDQLIRQVIQGGGNMPAYGNNLSPAETTALVAFLETLHPATQSPARDAARDLVVSEGKSKTAGDSTLRRKAMPHIHHAWSSHFGLLRVLILVALLYLRGWLRLRGLRLDRVQAWRAGGFLLGLFLIWLAMASPLSCARSRNADGAHGSTSSAHDVCGSLDLAGRAGQDIDFRAAASVVRLMDRSFRSAALHQVWSAADPSCNLLAGSGRHTGRMAYPCGVCAGVAIANVARN